MSTDYRYTIRRKADDKKIATFYYNKIKNLYDVTATDFELKLDPEKIRCEDDGQIRYTVDDMHSDIEKLDDRIKLLYAKIFEKKLLVPTAANIEVKDDMEADIFTLENEIRDCTYALDAICGLKAVVEVFVEDNVKLDGDDEDGSMAYVYNAEGLPKSPEGYSPSIWADDVYVEAKACI